MSTGQILFYAGVALLIVTVILAVFFFVKKPQYTPEGVVSGPNQTQRLINGYPTDPLTRGEPVSQPFSPPPSRPAAAGAVPLARDTAPLGEGTAPLAQGTAPLSPETEKLTPGTEKLGQETAPLGPEPPLTSLLDDEN